MGQRKVVQARDVKQGNVEIGRGFAVWSVERTALGGMLVEAESYVEGGLDACCGTFDIDDHAVGGGVGDCKTVGLREAGHRSVVGCSGTESAGELLDTEVLVEVGTLRIVDLLEETVELRVVTQGQRNGEAEMLFAGKMADQRGDAAGDRFGDLGCQGGS